MQANYQLMSSYEERCAAACAAVEAAFLSQFDRLKLGKVRTLFYARTDALNMTTLRLSDIERIIDEYKVGKRTKEEMFETLEGIFLDHRAAHSVYDATALEMTARALKDEIISEFRPDAYDRAGAVSIARVKMERNIAEMLAHVNEDSVQQTKQLVRGFVENLRDAGRRHIGIERG